ncbi:MAG: hypothetical protein AABZ44_04485, partial [Elusimicrobiota bacterium]
AFAFAEQKKAKQDLLVQLDPFHAEWNKVMAARDIVVNHGLFVFDHEQTPQNKGNVYRVSDDPGEDLVLRQAVTYLANFLKSNPVNHRSAALVHDGKFRKAIKELVQSHPSDEDISALTGLMREYRPVGWPIAFAVFCGVLFSGYFAIQRSLTPWPELFAWAPLAFVAQLASVTVIPYGLARLIYHYELKNVGIDAAIQGKEMEGEKLQRIDNIYGVKPAPRGARAASLVMNFESAGVILDNVLRKFRPKVRVEEPKTRVDPSVIPSDSEESIDESQVEPQRLTATAKKPGPGSAFRLSGGSLSEGEHLLVNRVVEVAFVAPWGGTNPLALEHSEYGFYDPEGDYARAGIKVYVIDERIDISRIGFMDRNGLADLVAHAGRTRRQAYYFKHHKFVLDALTPKDRARLARHEIAHIENPDKSEDEVEALEPVADLARKALDRLARLTPRASEDTNYSVGQLLKEVALKDPRFAPRAVRSLVRSVRSDKLVGFRALVSLREIAERYPEILGRRIVDFYLSRLVDPAAGWKEKALGNLTVLAGKDAGVRQHINRRVMAALRYSFYGENMIFYAVAEKLVDAGRADTTALLRALAYRWLRAQGDEATVILHLYRNMFRKGVMAAPQQQAKLPATVKALFGSEMVDFKALDAALKKHPADHQRLKSWTASAIKGLEADVVVNDQERESVVAKWMGEVMESSEKWPDIARILKEEAWAKHRPTFWRMVTGSLGSGVIGPIASLRRVPGKTLWYKDSRQVLKEKMPTLAAILADANKTGRFIYALSLLRLSHPFDMANANILPPIEWAKKNDAVFAFNELRIVPVSESFRRHIIYVDDPESPLGYYAVEVKIPGENSNRKDVGPEHFTIAKAMWDEDPEDPGVVKPVHYAQFYGEVMIYNQKQVYRDDDPLGIAVFGYQDGKRLRNALLHKEELVQRNFSSLAAMQSSLLLDAFCSIFKFHRLGWRASRGTQTDMHDENFRMLVDGRVVSAADFGMVKRDPRDQRLRVKETLSFLGLNADSEGKEAIMLVALERLFKPGMDVLAIAKLFTDLMAELGLVHKESADQQPAQSTTLVLNNHSP